MGDENEDEGQSDYEISDDGGDGTESDTVPLSEQESNAIIETTDSVDRIQNEIHKDLDSFESLQNISKSKFCPTLVVPGASVCYKSTAANELISGSKF